MEVTWILQVLVVVSVCIYRDLAKRCYICNSRDVPECGDLFMLTSQHVTWCSTSCYKFAVMKDEMAVITRGCLPEMKTYERCQTDRIGGLYGSMCTCNADYCNSAVGVKLSSLLIVLAVIVIRWI